MEKYCFTADRFMGSTRPEFVKTVVVSNNFLLIVTMGYNLPNVWAGVTWSLLRIIYSNYC